MPTNLKSAQGRSSLSSLRKKCARLPIFLLLKCLLATTIAFIAVGIIGLSLILSLRNSGYYVNFYHNETNTNNNLLVVNVKPEATTTKATTTTRKAPSRVTLTFRHYGGYVARFYVNWIENGQDKSWSFNGNDAHAGFVENLHIPDNSYNLRVRIIGCTFLAWHWWNTIIDESWIPVMSREFKIKGTSLSQTIFIDPPL